MQKETQCHQCKHFPIACNQLREKLRTESGTDLFDHIQRSGKVHITEEYPAETNKVECDQYTEETADAVAFFSFLSSGQCHPEFMCRQSNTMEQSPNDKVPGSPMPQTTQKHGNDKIGILANLSFPVSTQRYIEIIFQPTGKRNVPSPPKLCNGSGLIRRVKVLIKMKT